MTELKETVYEPHARTRLGWFSTWKVLLSNAWDSRNLIWQLFRRDFLMQYKKSFLGMTWLVINPLIAILSWVFYDATGVLTPGEVGIPYPAYVLLSTSIFTLWPSFQGAVAQTLEAGKSFVNQVAYNHDALLFKQLLSQFAQFGINFTVNLAVLLLFGVVPSWMMLLAPLLILPLVFLGTALGLVLALSQVVFPDFNRLVNLGVSLVMFVTPVVYSEKVSSPLLAMIVRYNPLTYIVGGIREAILYGTMQHWDIYLYLTGAFFLMFLFFWRLFYVAEEKVIEKIY